MPLMTFDEYYDKWLEEHAYSDNGIVKGWLRFSYFICSRIFIPLKFTPLSIDFLSLFLSLLIILIYSLFPYLENVGLLISAFMIIALLIIIGMMDNIDGIIARLTNQTSKKGSYQDLMFDRINDGIIIIAPIFSGYTEVSSVLFLLFSIFLFENLRSFHISSGIPMFSTVAERHARLVFQIGYMCISSCGYYMISLGYNVQLSINGKNVYFYPNLDILYISLGLISLIGVVQLSLKFWSTKNTALEISAIEKKEIKLNHLEENKPKLIQLLDLITCILLFGFLSVFIPENLSQVFSILSLIFLLSYTVNFLNQRRRILQESANFSRGYFYIIILGVIIGIIFDMFFQTLYFWIIFELLLLIKLIEKIYKVNLRI